MVELTLRLDAIFGSLADGTRRNILKRVSKQNLTISELAQSYAMSFAGIAKHVAVLERAGLITKSRKGKEQVIRANPQTVQIATKHLNSYEKMWQDRFDRLETLLNN